MDIHSQVLKRLRRRNFLQTAPFEELVQSTRVNSAQIKSLQQSLKQVHSPRTQEQSVLPEAEFLRVSFISAQNEYEVLKERTSELEQELLETTETLRTLSGKKLSLNSDIDDLSVKSELVLSESHRLAAETRELTLEVISAKDKQISQMNSINEFSNNLQQKEEILKRSYR